MKRNHIAIAGILASVLVTVDAAWAATDTGTVIASQAYVDAKVGTKQNKLNAGTGGNVTVDNTSNTAASRAITGITATGDGTVTFTTQPISVAAPAATTYVVDNATSALSISNPTTVTDKAPSVRAVYKMVRKSDATDGGIRAIDSASDVLVPTEKAVATALVERLNNSANTNTNAIIATDTKFAANPAIQKGVLYIKGAGLDNHSATSGLDTITAAHSWTTADGTNNSIKTIRESNKMDDYVPTMAAVEARVKEAEESAVQSVSEGSANGTIKVDGTNVSVHGLGTAAYIAKGANTASATANSLVTVNSNGFVTGTATAGALAKKDAVGSAEITDLSITNTDISNSANIAYTKMNGTLKDVNSASADASCTAASPCVLTYYKIDSNVYYKWTNLIETDGVTALPAS